MKKLLPLLIIALITSCGGNKVKGDSDSKTTDEVSLSEDVIDEDDEEDPPYKDYCQGITPDICTSEDGIVTIESSIRFDKGTDNAFWSYWKFKNKDGKTCKVFRELSPNVIKVHSIKKNDGTTYYITECFGYSEDRACNKWLEAYKIVGDTIEQVNVLDGSKKIRISDAEPSNEIAITYNGNNHYVAKVPNNRDWTYEYDPETRNFYVPILSGETLPELHPSDRYILWHFNGERFENMGEIPNKDLNESLKDYKELIKYTETEDYIVRIDALTDNQLRYAQWEKPKTMSDVPDKIITGGVKRTYTLKELPDYPSDLYCFSDGGYEYIVNQPEMIRDDVGQDWEVFYLIIKKNGKTVVKQQTVY